MSRYTPLVAALVLCACSTSPSAPGDDQRLSVVDFYYEPIVLEAPDTVSVGEPFEVTTATYGNGCLQAGATLTDIGPGMALIELFDRVPAADVCTDNLVRIDRTAVIRFEQAGQARILVRGQAQPENKEVLLEHDVFVR